MLDDEKYYEFDIGDVVLVSGRLTRRLARIVYRETEYDYDLPHYHWYKIVDYFTGDPVPGGLVRNDKITKLSPLEVLAVAAERG